MKELIERLLQGENVEITRFRGQEDNDYDVWKVTAGERTLVLKKASGREVDTYVNFLGDTDAAPALAAVHGDYILMKHVPGADLCRCDRRKLTLALDALIALQDRYWEDESKTEIGYTFEASLPGRENRGKYLNDPELEAAYDRYLERYKTVPRTLCHDDLLPFNVLVGEERAVLIDWEVGGLLPYLSSLARLIAHGDTSGADIFYMTDEDREFAIEYYYINLAEKKGISREDYREQLDDFLLYEYCEWIMLGNRYPDADMTRFHRYMEKAKEHLHKMK